MGTSTASVWLRKLVLGAISTYRRGVSPLLPRHCRFYPSCSAYTEEAVRRWGIWRGLRLGMGRVVRCHPWGDGGYDPVPWGIEEGNIKAVGECRGGRGSQWNG